MSKSGVILKISATLVVCGSTALADERSRGGDELAFFENELTIRMPNGLVQTNCADPTVIRGEGGDPYTLQAHYYSRGPMGYGMGKLQVLEHDGNGRLSFEERPFVVMIDRAYVDMGTVDKSTKLADAAAMNP